MKILFFLLLMVGTLQAGDDYAPGGAKDYGERSGGGFNPYRDSEAYRSGGGGYRPDGMTNSLGDQSRAHQRELERLDSEQSQRRQQQQWQGQSNPYNSSSDNRGKDGR